MLGRKELRRFPEMPAVPEGSASALLAAQLRVLMEAACPQLREAVAEYLQQARPLPPAPWPSSPRRQDAEYGRSDQRAMLEAVLARPSLLFELVSRTGAAVRPVGKLEVVTELSRMAPDLRSAAHERFAFPDVAKPVRASDFKWHEHGYRVSLSPFGQLRRNLPVVLEQFLVQDLQDGGRGPAADARRDLVPQLVRAAELLAAHDFLRSLLAGSLTDSTREQLQGQFDAAAGELAAHASEVRERMAGYVELLGQRDAAYARVDAAHAADLVDAAALDTAVRVDGILQDAAGRAAPVRIARPAAARHASPARSPRG